MTWEWRHESYVNQWIKLSKWPSFNRRVRSPNCEPPVHSLPWSQRKEKSLSHVQLFLTSWTVACQAPPSMGFSRQEYWSGLPFPSPGDLPDPGIKLGSPSLQADSLPSEPPGKPDKRGSSLCSFGRYLYFCSRIQSPPVLKFLDLM